jgi:hypothetical protein
VSCFEPIETTLCGEPVTVRPQPGLFTFIYDFERFLPSADITVVGIENPENFRFLETQKYLFPGIRPLFVSRYPQSSDLVRWLQRIPNPYLHFGDFDFAGIRIFLNEYRKHLGTKAQFFIPGNIDALVGKYGNRKLYNAQLHQAPDISAIDDPLIQGLIAVLHAHRKGLEQEILINQNVFANKAG